MTAARTPEGEETIIIHLGRYTRAGRPFYPPEVIMDEYLRWSDEHGGHVLYPVPTYGVRDDDPAEHAIILASSTPRMLIGDIAAAGRLYDPDRWEGDAAYTAPEPWASAPARGWLALDRLRPLESFDPSRYVLAASSKRRDEPPLTDVDWRDGIAPVSRIRSLDA